MHIGIKPGQIGLTVEELRHCWNEAEDAGFESIWTFDHLTGPLMYEATALLTALAMQTRRARIGCLVLANGTRVVETLAAQLATIDALSGGRLEAGIGASSAYAKLDFDALGLPYGTWDARLTALRSAVDLLLELTGPASLLGARPVQSPLPIILGGQSQEIRRLAVERGLAWNLSTSSPATFSRLAVGQPDPQAQTFLRDVTDVSRVVEEFSAAGATRLVFVLEPPIAPGDVTRLARAAGL